MPVLPSLFIVSYECWLNQGIINLQFLQNLKTVSARLFSIVKKFLQFEGKTKESLLIRVILY